MPLSYDLHLHPGPSSVPRWGDGTRVWEAARDAGVRGFVWKSHEEHTTARCARLPRSPVRVFASASLNPWAQLPDVAQAIDDGATWLWGPTMSPEGEIAWELPLPRQWDDLCSWLRETRPSIVLATGHLGRDGRRAMADVAREIGVTCSVTHSLLIPLDEALELAGRGCVLEIDAYTYLNPPQSHEATDIAEAVSALEAAGALVYLTSDGGQAATGNPFVFADKVVAVLSRRLSTATIRRLTFDGPAAVVEALDRGSA
jgi:hypothetical protein